MRSDNDRSVSTRVARISVILREVGRSRNANFPRSRRIPTVSPAPDVHPCIHRCSAVGARSYREIPMIVALVEGIGILRLRDGFAFLRSRHSAQDDNVILGGTISACARVPMPSHTSTRRTRHGTGAAAALRGRRESPGGENSCR